jgi:hypothetical protein
MIDELERLWKEADVAYSKYVEGLRKTTNNFSLEEYHLLGYDAV